MSQRQTVSKAKYCLDYDAFSRVGLIRQLASAEKSPEKDATAAADSLTVDYNQQAAKKAKSYLDYDSFSHNGMTPDLWRLDTLGL